MKTEINNIVKTTTGIIFISIFIVGILGLALMEPQSDSLTEVIPTFPQEVNEVEEANDYIIPNHFNEVDVEPNNDALAEEVEEEIVTTDPEVVSFTICSDVVDRNPIDALTEVDMSLGKIYTHTTISSETENTIHHVYKFGDETIAKVTLSVGNSPSWRTWSSKYIDPIWEGLWTVEVQSDNGNVLASQSFAVMQAVEETPADEEKPEELDEPESFEGISSTN